MTSLLNYKLEPCRRDQSPAALVVLHGLFGSARNWQTLGKHFADFFEVILPDLRNHGDSFRSASMAYEDMAEDILQLLDHLGVERAHILGHSMGGKVAMMCAHQAPERLAKLIVADIAPVPYGHDYDDLIDPILALDLARFKSRREVDQALSRQIPDQRVRMFLLQSLGGSTDTGLQWKLNWPVLKAQIEQIVGYVALDDWRIETPTAFIHGELSDYVQPGHRSLIEAHFTDCRFKRIEGAGHWVHAEQPSRFAAQVLQFLGVSHPQD